MMAANTSRCSSLLLWLAMAAIFSQNLVFPASGIEDEKNYYTPDPNSPTPSVPNLPTIPPPHGYGGGHPTPYHSTPPHHGGGGSSHGKAPPVNCGNPPTPSGGGHHHTTPSPPSGGGGGYYHSPPTSTPITPITPTPIVPSPPPPATITPPTTPIIDPGTPSTPGITIPAPPFSFDPNSPPFTCTYWMNHPTLVWGLFGWWGTTVGTAFGVTSLPGFGTNTNIIQALSNTRTDGLGQLYREGTAALLNSMAYTRFPYTTGQVRNRFLAALGSNKAAAAQARLFRMANEGRTKPRA